MDETYQGKYMRARTLATATLRSRHQAEFDQLLREYRADLGLVSRSEARRQRRVDALRRDAQELGLRVVSP